MNRTDARELWTRIASGDLERPQDPYDRDDLFQWIRNVARMVLAADEEPSATSRPYGITAAVGLGGRSIRMPIFVTRWRGLSSSTT